MSAPEQPKEVTGEYVEPETAQDTDAERITDADGVDL